MENNFMGFDDFIYVVKVTEDGEEFTKSEAKRS